ncbi:hypothetical protein PPERSA_08541 [Pseudocohnilembus persalinus]|uniref:Uncharacterized protein n=1 Tax=Pseudocohnilembus persalinus TaxID=266149 RepID=A0A0V0R712_PSEPJ|nr:hypothetical protein PPERSA_08541 [Pseudocohnilembus persalinus]|eukprot:KRX10138.1 hypothetical protein PPERSA_08541 [Pseudocohnilembus persalinus]
MDVNSVQQLNLNHQQFNKNNNVYNSFHNNNINNSDNSDGKQKNVLSTGPVAQMPYQYKINASSNPNKQEFNLQNNQQQQEKYSNYASVNNLNTIQQQQKPQTQINNQQQNRKISDSELQSNDFQNNSNNNINNFNNNNANNNQFSNFDNQLLNNSDLDLTSITNKTQNLLDSASRQIITKAGQYEKGNYDNNQINIPSLITQIDNNYQQYQNYQTSQLNYDTQFNNQKINE